MIILRNEMTPAQRVHELLALEVAAAGSVLYRRDWETRHGVEVKVRGRLSGTTLRGEVATALEVMVTLGLVECRWPERDGGVPAGQAQCYRWAKWATPEVLRWRVAAVKPPGCKTCGGPIPESDQHRETCSIACRKRAYNDRAARRYRARMMGV